MIYNYLDLFHGIGGFAYGAYLASMKFKNHFCSDIEPFCQKLYKLRFPNSIQLWDITKIDIKDLKKYGNNWIITGGFPCQDISIAGKGAGLAGERSGLWFEYWRIIRDLRPRFAIMENVSALTFRGLDRVLGSLAEIGYNAEWQIISAADVGAPHKRERIWIVAYPRMSGNGASGSRADRNRTQEITKRDEPQSEFSRQSEIMADTESRKSRKPTERKRRENFIGRSQEIPNTFSQHDDNSGYGAGEICRERSEATEIQRQFPNPTIKRLEREKSESKLSGREQGLSPECNRWPVEPAIRGMADGLPDKLDGYQGRLSIKSYERVNRLKGLGNSIVPMIAKILFEKIKPLL